MEQLADRARTDSKMSLQLRIADDLVASRGDAAMLRRALFNLVDNALRFTGAEGTVAITLKPGDTSMAIIEIRDTGRGLSAARSSG